MWNTVISILLIIALFALALTVPALRLNRAVGAVIKIFRKNNAVDSENAKTIDELGLNPPGMFERFVGGRDFKPQALQMLLQSRVILVTEDERLYLSEEDLVSSRLNRYAGRR